MIAAIPGDIELMPLPRSYPPCGLRISRKPGLLAWLGRARPGDRVTYWHGFLVVDRGSASSLDERERRRLDALATVARAAAAAGIVHLVQRRLAAGAFAYIAVKAHPAPGHGFGLSELRSETTQVSDPEDSQKRPHPALRGADRYVISMENAFDLEACAARASDAGHRTTQVEGAAR